MAPRDVAPIERPPKAGSGLRRLLFQPGTPGDTSGHYTCHFVLSDRYTLGITPEASSCSGHHLCWHRLAASKYPGVCPASSSLQQVKADCTLMPPQYQRPCFRAQLWALTAPAFRELGLLTPQESPQDSGPLWGQLWQDTAPWDLPSVSPAS